MKTFIQLGNTQPAALPPGFQRDDVRYAPALVETFLTEYTRPGDVVFDPFAGFGTTLVVAEAMGRRPLGLEYDPTRVDYIRSLLRDPSAIRHGDARRLGDYAFPPLDFSMTSPPYMNRDDAEDPLAAYMVPGQGYAAYLEGLHDIYAQLAGLLKPGARAVVEVANLKTNGTVTPLAWDVARALAPALTFEGEVVVGWDHYGYGYDHSYCLVFVKMRS
jgi:tRNA G10  N-methylase Trm11